MKHKAKGIVAVILFILLIISYGAIAYFYLDYTKNVDYFAESDKTIKEEIKDINNSLDELKATLENLNKNISGYEKNIAGIEEKISTSITETEKQNMNSSITAISNKLEDMVKKIENFFTEVDSKIDAAKKSFAQPKPIPTENVELGTINVDKVSEIKK